MNRLHIHISVTDLDRNIAFYSAMFGTGPNVLKPDYAKWQLDDPRVNFAISARGGKAGLDHLGIQTDSDAGLEAVQQRLSAAGTELEAQQGTTCCYARSDKYWSVDPQGIAWEAFHTLGSAPTFNDQADGDKDSACCAPAPADTDSCCSPAAETSTACCGGDEQQSSGGCCG